MKRIMWVITAAWLIGSIGQAIGQQPPAELRSLSADSYRSIQEAIDANPGRLIHVPAGHHTIDRKIQIRADHSGLVGPGRIIQSNADEPIIEIERASGVRIRDLTLTRAAESMDTDTEAVLVIECQNTVLDSLQILDNRSRSAAIALRDCRQAQLRGCLVRNYMRITTDDRTANHDWGYSFHCIDGTGISVTSSQGVLIQGCRVIEDNLLPTPETKNKFNLGAFDKKNPTKGALISQQVWDRNYVDNWHQGSAIIVTAPEVSQYVQILGNYIENAAQGIDIHADHVTISQNIINNAFVGMKAMHGSRNILIMGNQFSKNDLWSIGLMPGAASHAAVPRGPATESVDSNEDGGSIIANNIISDFGHGHAHWIWGDNGSPIRLDAGQKPQNPPLVDVIVQGNVVYRGGTTVPGGNVPPPRYQYAVILSADAKNIRFFNNIFHPGVMGISNAELKP